MFGRCCPAILVQEQWRRCCLGFEHVKDFRPEDCRIVEKLVNVAVCGMKVDYFVVDSSCSSHSSGNTTIFDIAGTTLPGYLSQPYLGVYTTNKSQINWRMALPGHIRILHVRKSTTGSNRPKAEILQGNRSMEGRACTKKDGRFFNLSIAGLGHEILTLMT